MIQPQQPVTATQEEVNSFYTLLQSTVNEQKDGAFLMGDFNAKLETDWENAGGAIGRFSIGYINEAGEQLIQFANANRLLETNTCFGQQSCRTRVLDLDSSRTRVRFLEDLDWTWTRRPRTWTRTWT